MRKTILARTCRRGATLLLLLVFCLAPAMEAWAPVGGGQGSHETTTDASDANDAAHEAQDAAESARDAVEAMQQGLDQAGQAMGANQGASQGAGVSLSAPGQAVTAMSGHAPAGGASPADRAKLDAVNVNAGAWSPF